VLCRTRTSAAQSSWNVRVPSDFVAYTSLPAEIVATISDVLRIALRDRTHTRTGTSGTHTSLHLSVYHSPVDTLCDTATVRESPLAFAAERGQNGNWKRRCSNPTGGSEGEKLNFIPRGIAELAFEFLSITSPRYFFPYLGNYLRRSIEGNVQFDYWGFYYAAPVRRYLAEKSFFKIFAEETPRSCFVGFQNYMLTIVASLDVII